MVVLGDFSIHTENLYYWTAHGFSDNQTIGRNFCSHAKGVGRAAGYTLDLVFPGNRGSESGENAYHSWEIG